MGLLKRGLGLIKVGKAIHDVRSATSEDNRTRAQHYLVELLGKSRGISAKMAQFMAMNSEDIALRETLDSSIPALPFKTVTEILDKAWQVPWDSVLSSLEKDCKVASLGQVHFGRLKNGRSVAIKVQFPEIAASVETELDLFGLMPKVGPVAKWGFHLEGYRDAFWHNFTEELDYKTEYLHQQKYREMVAVLEDVIVPEIFVEHCRPNVLVQSREDGFSIDEAEKMSQSDRQAIGRVVLRHYLHMLFRHGLVHSDPNPGNFAFRRVGRDKFALVLYDYGSILEIPENVKLVLLRIILALQYREDLDPASCLAALGFDHEKLGDLRHILPAMLGVLFDPFTTDAPYDVTDWNMSDRFEGIAGEMKWWFRSAAPPELIFLMRTLHGLVTLLSRLKAKLPWRFILKSLCEDMYPSARAITFPEPPKGPAMKFSGVAQLLKAHVIKSSGNEVKLTMPARVAENLQDVIDPPVMEAIVKQGIDLNEIQKRIRRSGFIPQVAFEFKDSERYIKVWLE
jgi:predicted unusual protein kinase regulating ubiquinone biosynthesis (AarF/ABC1/UbiB family)